MQITLDLTVREHGGSEKTGALSGHYGIGSVGVRHRQNRITPDIKPLEEGWIRISGWLESSPAEDKKFLALVHYHPALEQLVPGADDVIGGIGLIADLCYRIA